MPDWEKVTFVISKSPSRPVVAEGFVAVPADGGWGIKDVRDLAGLPFTTKADLRDNYPFGLFAVPMDEIIRLHASTGTTGKPKAVLLTHRNLEHACYVENRHHNQSHDDNFLCIPPLYHTGAKMHWFGNFIVGAKAVILKGIEPRWILRTI